MGVVIMAASGIARFSSFHNRAAPRSTTNSCQYALRILENGKYTRSIIYYFAAVISSWPDTEAITQPIAHCQAR
jgi:hypothetical protein